MVDSFLNLLIPPRSIPMLEYSDTGSPRYRGRLLDWCAWRRTSSVGKNGPDKRGEISSDLDDFFSSPPFFPFPFFFSFFIVTRPTPRPSSPRQASQRRRHVHACVHAYIVAWRAHTCGVVERAGGTEDNSNDCTNPLVSTLYKSRARTVLGNNGPQRV